jgi:dihydroneopterin aldolase
MTDKEELLTWRMVMRDVTLDMFIGINPPEYLKPQPVVINLYCDYTAPNPHAGQVVDVLCYDTLLQTIKKLAYDKHVPLVENLAQSIADACLADVRVHRVWVRIEKPEALPEAAGVGVEITRRK